MPESEQSVNLVGSISNIFVINDKLYIKYSVSFVFKLKKLWIPRSSRGMTFLSACCFVIPAEAGIQTFFLFDVFQLFYERTNILNISCKEK